MRVGARWRLCLCCDLHVEHRQSVVRETTGVQRAFESGFGMGRSYAVRAFRLRDYVTIARSIVGEGLCDLLAFIGQPSREMLRIIYARPVGVFRGYRSAKALTWMRQN
jgi:hypothetical protein